MKRADLTKEEIEIGKRLKLEGYGWRRIGKLLDCSELTARRAIDPDFDAAKRAEHAARSVSSDEEIRRLRATIPMDTRSRVARWMGDPIPGRSALDARGARQ